MTELRASSQSELCGSFKMCAATLYSSNSGSYNSLSISFLAIFNSSTRKKITPNLCKVELQRVVRAQADVESCLEKVGQRIPLVREEERIVT
jgi:hypothetical protein